MRVATGMGLVSGGLLWAQDAVTGEPFNLGSLIPVLGVSVVFIYVWLMTNKDLKQANKERIDESHAHAAQLVALIDRMAPVLVSAAKTLEAMEKGAAHVAEQVATTHSSEYSGLRADLQALLVELREERGQ